jgi:hypothetical protein
MNIVILYREWLLSDMRAASALLAAWQSPIHLNFNARTFQNGYYCGLSELSSESEILLIDK